MLFAVAMIVLLVTVFVIAEFIDRRNNRRRARVLRDAVRAKGRVVQVRKKGILDARDGYQWSIVVEFEYNGEKYSIEAKSVQKTVYAIGDTISVHVDRKDPWKSVITI